MKMRILLCSFVLGLLSFPALSAPVDINTADAKALSAALHGVGTKTAAAIVEYRSKHGPFKSINDLTRVKGIGPKTVERNRANMTVGEPRKK